MHRSLVWDLFCRVIDNHGDLGVCWRLASDLAARGQQVRLWIDDGRALQWMAPQGCPGVQCRDWREADQLVHAPQPGADVLVEAFGCDIPEAFLAATVRARAGGGQPVWINLEYLSAEPYVERSHTLPSPVQSGPARTWTKHFFYPGFTARTGGLLREQDLAHRQQGFDRLRWLQAHGIADPAQALVASLFCYEPAALPELLAHWAQQGHLGRAVNLLVTAGRATEAVRACLPADRSGLLRLVFLPYLSQKDYDHLLWASDLNLVRGEDSLVRALWAGQPLVWQLYPQDDGAHWPKLQAFLQTVGAPPAARQWHEAWNPAPPGERASAWRYPDPDAWRDWQQQALACRQSLQRHDDLSTQLLAFVAGSAAKTS